MNTTAPPAWDQEGTLTQARAQVRRRVVDQAADREGAVRWLRIGEPAVEIRSIEQLGDRVVVGSEMTLWCWPNPAIQRLSGLLRERNGLLVFIEPTAAWGWRRPLQLLGRRYRRDIPAELRAVGFSVTTQVRLCHGAIGTYVRGEARHFD